jgi:Asp-tRNA(Asn)/Glu-tRNA(Gln) amidotransferase A subunit family amidase
MRTLLAGAAAVLLICALPRAQQRPQFRLEEATIADVHAAMKSGSLTCRSLVEQYLRRIEAYDKNGPAINAIVEINAKALGEADDLDRK